ncbi:MAG: hypothetical protein IJ264_03350 [Clostridia bacterium]|nr:hypothetical protein [Clostridia bacterium]
MNENMKKTRVNLDGLHSLDISVNEENKTVIAELVVPDEKPTFIYAEKFDAPCNYLKAAIKKGVVYLDANRSGRLPGGRSNTDTLKG